MRSSPGHASLWLKKKRYGMKPLHRKVLQDLPFKGSKAQSLKEA